jgi:predicted peptidase
MSRWNRRALPVGLALVLLGVAGCGAATPATAPTAAPAPTLAATPELSPPAAPAATAAPAPATRATSAVPASELLRFESFEAADQTKIEYAVTTPPDFDAAKEYPVLLAMPPGGQDHDVTDQLMRSLWSEEARKRGWVVISPVAPGQLYFDGAERYIPALLDATAKTYRPAGGKYYLAGISNGGLSAFRIILNTPERFRSLLVLPGVPPTDADKQKLAELKDIPVAMFVGENDSGWRAGSEETQRILTGLGGHATLELAPGEGHIIRSLTGARLFDLLEQFRAGS